MRYTEQILNSRNWVDANGSVSDVSTLEEDHLHNILSTIYKSRDRYWLNCKDVQMISAMRNGDEFFAKIIRRSQLWTAILKALTNPTSGFNLVNRDVLDNLSAGEMVGSDSDY